MIKLKKKDKQNSIATNTKESHDPKTTESYGSPQKSRKKGRMFGKLLFSRKTKSPEQIQEEEEIGKAELLSPHYSDSEDEGGVLFGEKKDKENRYHKSSGGGTPSKTNTASSSPPAESKGSGNRRTPPPAPFQSPQSIQTNAQDRYQPQHSPMTEQHPPPAEQAQGNNQHHLTTLKQLTQKHLQEEMHKLSHFSLGDDLTVSTYSQLRPVTPVERTSSHKSISSQMEENKRNTLLKVRRALTRPSGRTGIPPLSKRYHVEISKPEWDPTLLRWKYSLHIQENHPTPQLVAKTTRTLPDFSWLEQSLRKEYNGGLLLPLLSLSLQNPFLTKGKNEVASCVTAVVPTLDFTLLEKAMDGNEVVDEKCLGDWLSDVLNHIRGAGELLLKNPNVFLDSESIETFLYRNIDYFPSKSVDRRKRSAQDSVTASCSTPSENSRSSRLGEVTNACTSFQNWFDEGGNGGAVASLLWKPFLCFHPSSPNDDRGNGDSHKSLENRGIPLEMISCKSRSKANEMIHSPSMQRSMSGESHVRHPNSIHCEAVEFQRDLLSSYRFNTDSTLTKLRVYYEEETVRNAAWKRFAISLSNLYSFEKDLETTKIGTSHAKKDKHHHKKLSKTAVDDGLRVLARQKQDRCLPSLKFIGGMLNSYLSDLASIQPNLQAYSEAMNRLAVLETSTELKLNPSEDSSTNKLKREQDRIYRNEDLLKNSLSAICDSNPIRMARMSYKYFKLEAGQASLLHGAAGTLMGKILQHRQIPSEDSEEEDKVNEAAKELEIIRQLLEIGLKNKFESAAEEEEHRHQCLHLCETAMNAAHDRLGRWNAELALSIMEAAGVEDAEVSVEETTRDLRFVRKYAIGLRSCVERCQEALHGLRKALKNSSTEARDDFLTSLSIVWSGVWIPNSSSRRTPSQGMLHRYGIDRSGWLYGAGDDTRIRRILEQLPSEGRGVCGKISKRYRGIRQSSTSNVLEDMEGMLQGYETRVEEIESFVYMHCVGIQMEKHFSKRRKEELAAWEKKTDITTAINIAQRKRLPLLVNELKAKLESLPPNISHTSVKQAKERHLASKALKTELQNFANQRLLRLKASATHCVLDIIRLWSQYEESVAKEELKTLGEAIREIERNVTIQDIDADGGAHLFASSER